MNDLISKITDMVKKDASIVALWLYGSRARGDFHPDSDYDLAVGFNDWLEDPLERRLRPELMAQQWRDSLGISESELSVVDISLVPIPLGLAILTDGQLLLDGDASVRLGLERRILSRWEHDYGNRDQWGEKR